MALASMLGRQVRRQAASRACDRCRRRKAKCDYEASADTCGLCRDNNVRCTFDVPLAKRGPKSKKRLEPPGASLDSAPGSAYSAGEDPRRLSSSTSDHPPVSASVFESSSTLSAASNQPWNAEARSGTTLSAPSPTSSRSYPFPRVTPSTPHGPTSAQGRWRSLSRTMSLQNKALHDVVEQCLALFFEYLYPLTPLVHEQSLRDGFAALASNAPGVGLSQLDGAEQGGDNLAAMSPPWSALSPELTSTSTRDSSRGWIDATFTLITAVCAEAAFLLPKEMFPQGESVAGIFLQASRDCLNSYLDADLENPSANSITIRYFHSNCVHAAGRPKHSWHIFGEASRLAQVMQLHDESSLEGLHPIEAELRRRAFWIVYMGDKSAAILNNRPITMHKYSFENGITTAYPSGIDDQVMGQANAAPNTADTHARNFIAGFNANLKLWQTASDLLLHVRLLQDQNSLAAGAEDNGRPRQAIGEADRPSLDAHFVRFITCLDDLPPYLQSYTFAAITNPGAPTTEVNQFIIQCANLQVSFHCLRMVITQKFEEIGYFAPGPEQADLRKTEIVRDMLRVMHEAPFWSLQVNGEPYVEKIRLIGATLLAIIHGNQASPLATRARSDFSVLLDILTRLDSKASDALKSTSTLAV